MMNIEHAAYRADGIGQLASLMHYSSLETRRRNMQALCSQHLSIVKQS